MSHDDPEGKPTERRRFLNTVGRVAMAGGLAASYGTCAALSGRFLYPAEGDGADWQFVTEVARISLGEAFEYRAPNGVPINIARRAASGDVSDFIALSSTCPHLGCRVHWQSLENRFFCPCHNGVFTPEGEAISGPPAEAGQWLARYPLRIESGLLYIRVPMQGLEEAALAPTEWPRGHDPCLKRRPPCVQPDQPDEGQG